MEGDISSGERLEKKGARTGNICLTQSAIHISSLAEIDIPMLYSFSPSIVPPPSDWPDWIHTTGYWFLDEPELSWNPPDSLLDFIKVGPPVYIGFGSIVVQDADEMTRIIIQAVEQAGVRVILCKGWSDRLSSGIRTKFKYPDSIHCIDRAPHDWLFPKMAGVVHHGGAGTTAAGIRAGVPTAIRPFFGDQYFWAERICDLGVGVALKKFTVAKLAQALISISTDVKMKEKARILSEKVKRENGVQTAIQYVYRDLQLANEQMQSLKAKESN